METSMETVFSVTTESFAWVIKGFDQMMSMVFDGASKYDSEVFTCCGRKWVMKLAGVKPKLKCQMVKRPFFMLEMDLGLMCQEPSCVLLRTTANLYPKLLSNSSFPLPVRW